VSPTHRLARLVGLGVLALGLARAPRALAEEPARSLVSREYTYSWMLLGGEERFLRECLAGPCYRLETAIRVLNSMDASESRAPVGFDLAAIPDSLAAPERLDKVTLVDARAGTYADLEPGQMHEFAYPFDPAHPPACPKDDAPDTAAAPHFERLPDERVAGRVAHHFRTRVPLDGVARELANFPLLLAEVQDTTSAVFSVADVWTCVPDPLLRRWRDAHKGLLRLVEIQPDTTYDPHWKPFVCAGDAPVLASRPPVLGVPDSEIVVGIDLSNEYERAEIDTTVAHAIERIDRANDAAHALPIAWRGRAAYTLRWRLLDLAEVAIDPALYRVPAGYEILNADVPEPTPAAPAARPRPHGR